MRRAQRHRWLCCLVVVVVAVIIPLSTVADDSSLRERLLREGPVGWAKLEQSHLQIVGTGTLSTHSSGVDPIQPPKVEQWEIKRNGDLVRAIRVRSRVDGKIESAAAVYGPKFGFFAWNLDGADYVVNSMGPDRGIVDGFVGNGIGAYLNASWNFYGRSFSKLLVAPQLTLGEITSVEEDGKELVKVEFRYTPSEEEVTKWSGNTFFFDPNRHWALQRGELMFGGERSNYVVVYREDLNDMPTPKRVSWIRPVGDDGSDAYHELRFEFDKLAVEEVPEEEFTLAAFGLAGKKINIKGGKIRAKQ